MKYQLILESDREVALKDVRSSALMHGINAAEVTFADQTHIPRTEVLWVLQTADLEGEYDERHEQGAYEALSPTAKEELFRLVKKGLEFGLGETWTDCMNTAIDEALRYRQID